MANITIDPRIPLGVNPPKTMTLPELLSVARGAEEFRQAQQINPLLLQQQQAQTGTAKTQEMAATENLSKARADRVFGIVGGFMNDPRISSGDPQKTVEAMLEIRRKAIASGVPEAQVEAILSPISSTAAHNAAALPQMITNVIQAQLGPQGQQALQTPQLTTSAGAPALFRPGPGMLTPTPIQGAPTVPQQIAPQVAPMPQATPAGQPPVAPRAGVTSEMLTAPIPQRGGPGFALSFPVRPAGDIRPMAPGEENARALGEKTRASLLEAQAEVPRATRSVGEIIRIADDLAKDVRFQTGSPADIERAIRQNLGGDARYKELAKDIAQVQMAINKANNAATDQQTAQVAAGTGDATYPPDVLVKIARRLRGELTEIDARTRGAQEFKRRFGDANLADFQQAWSQNSDLRNFEVMAILRDVRDPAAQKAALDKILPNNQEELRELQRKYQAIEKLTRTGTLR